jgi:hypothetical protein
MILPSASYDLHAGPPRLIGGTGRGDDGMAVKFPAELYPPADSRPIILTAQQTIAAAGSVTPAALTRQLPLGWVGVIRSLEIFADSPLVATRALWQLQINGAPVFGMEAVTMIFRDAASLARDFDNLRIAIPDNATISVQITNVDGAPRLYGAQLVGWEYQIPQVTQARPDNGR